MANSGRNTNGSQASPPSLSLSLFPFYGANLVFVNILQRLCISSLTTVAMSYATSGWEAHHIWAGLQWDGCCEEDRKHANRQALPFVTFTAACQLPASSRCCSFIVDSDLFVPCADANDRPTTPIKIISAVPL
jgi:hypothetical protein